MSVFVPLYQKTAYSVNMSLKFSLFGLFVLMSVKVIQFKLCPPWHNILTWLFHIRTCKALKNFWMKWHTYSSSKSSHHREILPLWITVSCCCQWVIWGVTGGMQKVLITCCKFGAHVCRRDTCIYHLSWEKNMRRQTFHVKSFQIVMILRFEWIF